MTSINQEIERLIESGYFTGYSLDENAGKLYYPNRREVVNLKANGNIYLGCQIGRVLNERRREIPANGKDHPSLAVRPKRQLGNPDPLGLVGKEFTTPPYRKPGV